MADLKRWFKVWTSILDDPHHTDMALEDVGRWCRLGALLALVGDGGRLCVTRPATRLCQVLEVATLDEAFVVLKRLPNVHVEEGQSVNDISVVTLKNWSKYQEDSTVAERVKRLRRKRRGEESRGDKKRSSSPDDEFLNQIRTSPAYAGIDVDRELRRMDVWLLAHPGRQKTRRFVVGWLNKIERPLAPVRVDDEDAE